MTTDPAPDETTPTCPWCGEDNLPGRSAQVTALGGDSWLCGVCSKTFMRGRQHTRAQGDGDDGQDDRDVSRLSASFSEHISARRHPR